MNTPAVILLLAAGGSRRMRGRDKLLEPVDGRPLLRRQAEAALSTGAPVIVALPPGDTARRAALDGLAVAQITVEDARLGMGHSLAAAALAAPAGADLLVVLADMPEIGRDEMATVLAARAAHPGKILRGATPEGQLGHPVLFPARLAPLLHRLRGDEGARQVMQAEPVAQVTLAGSAAVTDLDTPEAWTAWRKGNPGPAG